MFTWNFDEIGFKEAPNIECSKHKKSVTHTSQNGTLFLYSQNTGQNKGSVMKDVNFS